MSLSVLLATALLAQTARPAFTEFEVASIKPTPPGGQGRWIRMQGAHQFAAKNHALLTLIAAAYNLSSQAISGGPPWLDSDHFDIVAKTPHEVRPNLDEQMAMLRKLLADRFHLRFHREARELAVYALTVVKTGAKLNPTTLTPDAFPEGAPPLIFSLSPPLARLPARYATMEEFASVLQRAALDRPVVDRTGLTARYDFDLEWLPDEPQFGGALGRPSLDSDKPNLFKAVQQQLGLKLETTKAPVQVLVIDHADHPSQN